MMMLMLAMTGPLDVTGVWETKGGRAHVEISMTEDDSLFGEVIWYASYAEHAAAGGEGAKQQDKGILGATLIEGFERGSEKWRRGTIHDLNTGRSYRATLKRKNEDTLLVEGCLALFCRTQQWTRVPESEVKRLPQ